jgi:hypothetical protein
VKRRPQIVKLCALIFVFACAGAIVNVAVAWLLALQPPTLVWSCTDQISPTSVFQRYCPPDRLNAAQDAKGLSEIRKFGAITYQVGSCWTEQVNGKAAYCTVMESRFGWPLAGLRSGLFQEADPATGKVRQLRSDMLWRDEQRDQYLPIGVDWMGSALNTLFYAAILWLLFITPGKVRRFIRIRRGLCPACAYPIGTSQVCTECGKPVKALPQLKAA